MEGRVLRLCFLAAHLRPVKEKAGTAHEQLGRGSLAAWDLELGVLRTAMTAAGRVGLRLFGIPGQSGGRSNRSFMRCHGNCCGGCGRCGGGGDVGEACRSHRDSGTPHRPPPRRMVARIRQRSCDWAITPAGVEMHSEEAVRHGEASNRFDVPLPDDLATWAAVVQSFRMRTAWSSTLQK